MVFNSYSDLEKEIMRRAESALKTDVADSVKEKLKEHIENDVYGAYGSMDPLIYERRKSDGGLLDDKNITSTIDSNNCIGNLMGSTLTVTDKAHIEGPRIAGYSEQPGKTPLATLLESGKVENPWTGYRGSWTKARRFISKTQAEVNAHPSEIADLIRKSIDHRK